MKKSPNLLNRQNINMNNSLAVAKQSAAYGSKKAGSSVPAGKVAATHDLQLSQALLDTKDANRKGSSNQTTRGVSLPDIGSDGDNKVKLRAFIEELRNEIREKEQMIGALKRNFDSLSGLCLKAEAEKQN